MVGATGGVKAHALSQVMRPGTISRLLIIGGCLSSLSACGYLFGDSGAFRDTSNDYRLAEESAPIELPDGVSPQRLSEIYAIPALKSAPRLQPGTGVPRPAPLISASADQLVRIQRLGTASWALIAIAPGQLWPQLRSFLSAANFEVARMDARAGIIESTYLDLQGQTQPSRFQFRVERGVQRGNSELHVRQMYQSSEDGWPEVSDDVELESDLLRGIAQYIANSADTAPVSMMAEQSISSSGKVFIDEDAGGEYINLELSFDRAWASLARSLEVSGFEVTDRNRSEGRYFVLYGTPDSEEKSGLFGWLGGGKDEHPAANKPLLVTIDQADTERMEIRLAPEQAKAVSDQDLQSLLQLIKGNIN